MTIKNTKRTGGPRTTQGKLVASQNSLKTGAYSKLAVLPDENQEEFNQLIAQFNHDFHPQDVMESSLIRDLAVITWRKLRLERIEQAFLINKIEAPITLEEFQSCGKGFSESAFGYWFQTKEFSLAIVPEFQEVLAFIHPFRHKKISIADLAVLKKKCPPGYQLILENYAKLHPLFLEKPTPDELSAALIDTPERTRTLLTMDTLTLVYGNYEALLWCTLNQERIKQALSTIKQERLLMLMQSDELRRANDDLSRSLIRTMNEFRRHHQWRMQNRVFDAEPIEAE